MANRDFDAFPERSTAIARAFGAPLNRAVVVGGVAAGLLASVLTLGGVVDHLDAFGTIAVAPLSALGGAALAIVSIPSRIRRAFEAYSWLGHAETQRFRERTGGPVPTKHATMLDWLGSTPSTPTMRLARIELLAFVGRFDEARAELALAVANEAAADPTDGFELTSLAQYIDWIEHGSTDVSTLREAAQRLPADSASRQAAEVTVAIALARPLAVRADAGWTAPLEAVRASLGSAPWRATLRDTWWPIWVMYLFLGLLVALAASVLRSAL